MNTPPRPEICVGAIARQGDALLLIERGRGAAIGEWSVPGGRVEFGESLAEAVRREMAEETGLDVVVGDVVDWVERISAEHHFVIVDFTVTVVDGTLRAGDDAADARWVPIGDLGSVRLVDGLLAFLQEHRLIDV